MGAATTIVGIGIGVSVAGQAGGSVLPGLASGLGSAGYGAASDAAMGSQQGAFSAAGLHDAAVCGPSGPLCDTRPFGSSPIDQVVPRFLDTFSPRADLVGETIGSTLLASSAPEHIAAIIRTAAGGYRLGPIATSKADTNLVDPPDPGHLTKGEKVVGLVHGHRGTVNEDYGLAQSNLDVNSAKGLAKKNPNLVSYVVGPAGKGRPVFGVIVFEYHPPPLGTLTTVYAVP